jgi:hypothetical protein
MLSGFSIETKPLTELEQQLLPVVVRGLSKKLGASNAVTNKAICEGLLKTYKIDVSEARIRKLINHIRMHNLVPGLVANGCGYFISNNPDEVKNYIQSLYGREQAIKAVREKTQAYLNELLRPYQSSLFNK